MAFALLFLLYLRAALTRAHAMTYVRAKRVASIGPLNDKKRSYIYLTKYYNKNAGQNVELCEFVFDRISAEFALPLQ